MPSRVGIRRTFSDVWSARPSPAVHVTKVVSQSSCGSPTTTTAQSSSSRQLKEDEAGECGQQQRAKKAVTWDRLYPRERETRARDVPLLSAAPSPGEAAVAAVTAAAGSSL